MMTAEQLKGSILQLAIQGKLVEQRAEEGTGEELYKEIQQKKERLIKKGRIKKDKKFTDLITTEYPFDIPETWRWVKFGSVMNVVSARRVHQADWKHSGIPFYRAREIAKLAETGSVENELFISEELFEEFSKSGVPEPGDLMVTGVGTLGKTYVVKEGDKFYYKDASVLCFENYANLEPLFIKQIMESPSMKGQIKSNSSGTTVATLTMVRMVEYLIPLPPLAEQKRIVAKIEELMPFVEQYATASTKLNTLNATFPEMMKKSILQEAVQGKLVPQDPNDEPASVLLKKIAEEKKRLIKEGKIKKQKPLPEIMEAEIPFDIPESWEWVRIGSYFSTSSGTTPSKSNVAYYNHKDFNWVRTTDLNNGILDKCEIQVSQKAYEECRLEIIPQESVCIAMYGGGGTIGKNALIKFDTTINQSVCAIYPNGCNMKYVQLFMQYIRPKWMDFASGSRKDPNISQIVIKNCLIPIPPLKEQERIVEIALKLMDSIEQM